MSQPLSIFCLFLAATIVLGTAPCLSAQGGKRAIKNQQRSNYAQKGKSAVKSRVVDYSGKANTRYRGQSTSATYSAPQSRQVSNANTFSVKAWKPAVQAFPAYEVANYREQQASRAASSNVYSASPARSFPEAAAPKIEETPDAPTNTPMRMTAAPSQMEEATIAARRDAEITRKRELMKLTAALAQGETFSVPTPGSPSEVNGAMPAADEAPDQTSSGTTGPDLTGSLGHLQAAAIPPKNEGRNVGGVVNLDEGEVIEITGSNETPCITVNSGGGGFGGGGSLGIPYSDSVAAQTNPKPLQMPSTMAYCIPGVEAGDDYTVDEMEKIMLQLSVLERRNDWTIPGAYQALKDKLIRARELYNTIFLRYRDRGYMSLINHYQSILDSLNPMTGKYKPGMEPDPRKISRRY